MQPNKENFVMKRETRELLNKDKRKIQFELNGQTITWNDYFIIKVIGIKDWKKKFNNDNIR